MTTSDLSLITTEERAAWEHADWQQVALNGGPPCFHLENKRFCLRAKRWAGHGDMHIFLPLPQSLIASRRRVRELEAEREKKEYGLLSSGSRPTLLDIEDTEEALRESIKRLHMQGGEVIAWRYKSIPASEWRSVEEK